MERVLRSSPPRQKSSANLGDRVQAKVQAVVDDLMILFGKIERQSDSKLQAL